ncbi:RsmE family RNA methyltransferase [uncultured Rubinisphaera sp.]|uniref:RsmE family RNA methyltransferase n=1 Tax=uncultured Rubinisphaera sp. TaxID=1678686 RepID=UPI0030DA556D
MSKRYYHPAPWKQHEIELEGPEAHHLIHVMRAKVGDELELFDGAGGVAPATIINLKRKTVSLEIDLSCKIVTEEADFKIVLATAVPKGDRFRWLVEKATELGVSELIPLNMERSSVAPRESKIDKHRQYIIEACKQSGRNHLMRLQDMQSFSDFCKSNSEQNRKSLLGDLNSDFDSFEELQSWGKSTTVFTVVVGPEGGLSDLEFEIATQCDMRRWQVGSHILRTETAGLAMATLANLLRP